jgi:hypothetical protein
MSANRGDTAMTKGGHHGEDGYRQEDLVQVAGERPYRVPASERIKKTRLPGRGHCHQDGARVTRNAAGRQEDLQDQDGRGDEENQQGISENKPKVRSMPMETKELVKTSRKGRILPRAWWLYSDSEMTIPARNAPRARERPTEWVSQATARQITITLRRKSSRFFVRATRKNKNGMIHFAPAMTSRMMATSSASSKRRPFGRHTGRERGEHHGHNDDILKIRMPRQLSVRIYLRPFLKIFITMAVLLSETANR